MLHSFIVLIISCWLSACTTLNNPSMAQLPKPSFKSLQIVAMNSPPLRLYPDYIYTSHPGVTMQNQTLPLPQLLVVRPYLAPGGLVIRGLAPQDQPEIDTTAAWQPALSIAEQTASALSRQGIIHAHVGVTGQHGQNYPDAEKNDAVMELAIRDYAIWEGQFHLEVLLKLIDPSSGKVLGSTRQISYQAVGPELRDFAADNGVAFKQRVSRLGQTLVLRGLQQFGVR